MTDYKTIFGKKIKFLTADLTAGPATEGEVFYSGIAATSSAAGTFNFKVGVNVESWAAGNNSTRMVSPALTRYCFPPVFTIAKSLT